MEEKIVKIIGDRKLEKSIVYSSFYAASIEKLKRMEVPSELAILDNKVSDCLYKLRGGCGAEALHPFWKGMDLKKDQLEGMVVRAYMGGHLYPEKSTGNKLNFAELEEQGITDIILNEPEVYVE